MDAALGPKCWVILAGKRPLYADLNGNYELHAYALDPMGPGIAEPGAALRLIKIAAVHNDVFLSRQGFSEGPRTVLSGAHGILRMTGRGLSMLCNPMRLPSAAVCMESGGHVVTWRRSWRCTPRLPLALETAC